MSQSRALELYPSLLCHFLHVYILSSYSNMQAVSLSQLYLELISLHMQMRTIFAIWFLGKPHPLWAQIQFHTTH